MKAALAITLSVGVGAFATLPFLLHGHLLQTLAFGMALLLAGIAWKYSRSWWLPASFFGMIGISHLFAGWWLRSQGHPSTPALETFGPGYLLIAAWYLLRKRWFGKAPTTS